MSGGQRLALAGVLAGVQLLAVLDGLAASLALPAIGADLGLGPAGLAWTLNTTSVALAGGLLVAGRLGDVVGRRPLFLTGVALLGVGSLVSGAATTPAVLFAGRTLLGVAAALAYPSALALTSSLFTDEPWRTRAFAAASVAGASGAVAGAVYGGVVTGVLGWRWVFWLTVPVALALLAAAWWLLPHEDDGGLRSSRSLDLPGAALATLATASVVGTVIGVGTDSMTLTPAAALALVGASAACLLVVHERRVADPLLPTRVVGSRRLRGGCGGMAASSALWSVVVFVLSQQLQEGGLSSTRAGLALLPASIGIVVGGTLVVPRLRRRAGSVRVALGGLLLGAVSTGWLALAPADPSYVGDLLVPLLLLGAALSAISTGLMEHTLKDGAPGAESVSAAVLESSLHVGGAVSVAVYAALLATTGGPAPAYAAAAGFALVGFAAAARWSPAAAPGEPVRTVLGTEARPGDR